MISYLKESLVNIKMNKNTTLILSDNSSDFTTNLSPPIYLNANKQYEAALLSINLYNSIPNVTEKNNKFRYSADNGDNWKNITLSKGSYELPAINDEIQRQMLINGDYDSNNNKFYITITANIAELKSIIDITNESYLVDFTVENSIGSTLGFNPLIIRYGHNKSQNIVDITKVNSVLVNVDIISGSYVNGNQSPAIYSFDPNRVSPGYKIDERPNPTLIFYHVSRLCINSVRVWLTDQDHNPIDTRGERVTVKLIIREVKNIKHQIKKAIKELKAENII
jgi:hypothetical protein